MKHLIILLSGNPAKYKRQLLSLMRGLAPLWTENNRGRHKEVVPVFDCVVTSFVPESDFTLSLWPQAGGAPAGVRETVKYYCFGRKAAEALPYPQQIEARRPFKLKPGNVDIAFLLTVQENPGYDYYWLIEDDVAASGAFSDIILRLCEQGADLLCTHLQEGAPTWTYHSLFNFDVDGAPPREGFKLAFLPFFRLSAAGVKALDTAYRNGWAGHAEMVLPAVMERFGLSVQDIGAYNPENQKAAEPLNGFYTGYIEDQNGHLVKKGGFVPTPARLRPGKPDGLLWHPVKPFFDWIKSLYKRVLSVITFAVRSRLG